MNGNIYNGNDDDDDDNLDDDITTIIMMMMMICFDPKGKQQGKTLESNLRFTGGRQAASPLRQHCSMFLNMLSTNKQKKKTI